MPDMAAIRTTKKLHSDCVRALKKEKATLDKLKESNSVHEVRVAEAKVIALMEEINILEVTMRNSWVR